MSPNDTLPPDEPRTTSLRETLLLVREARSQVNDLAAVLDRAMEALDTST